MIDGNEHALVIEEMKNQRTEIIQEEFLDYIDDLLIEHSLIVEKIQKEAKNFKNRDLREYVSDLLKDEI